MRSAVIVVLLCLFTLAVTQDVPEEVEESDHLLAEGEKKLSDNILAVMEHYKQPDPVGIPVVEVPEPYPVPDMKQALSFGTMYFKNTAVFGLSKFKILHVIAGIDNMKAEAALTIDKLQARGNYTLSSWFNKAQGPFTVDITGLRVDAQASLGVERDGQVRAQDIHIDLSFTNIAVNFENLGFFGSMFQGIINSVGNFLFDSIKPFILKEAYAKIRVQVNEQLETVAGDIQFPNSISPLDMVIADLRKKVRNMNLDPYQVKNYNKTESVFNVALTHTWVYGISSFQRVGNITLKMENHTLIADFEIGTQKLEGSTHWDITAINGIFSRAGTASFSAEYITGRFVLAQPLDTRQRPECRDLQLEIGNIQVRCNGAGTLDYVIEFVVNVLPNLLRYQIMDAVEGPLKEKIQKELNKINVEEYIKQKLPKLDKMQEKEFKLSALINNAEIVEEPYDEDEFFNF